MTQAQIQYLANLEVARHNRETEEIQSRQAAAAEEQAAAATSRARTEQAKIPAAYVPAATGAVKGITALGGVIGKAINTAKQKKGFTTFLRNATRAAAKGAATTTQKTSVVTAVTKLATTHPIATAATALGISGFAAGSYRAKTAQNVADRVGIDVSRMPKQQQYTFFNRIARNDVSGAEAYLKTLLKAHPEWRKENENENT